MTINFRQRVASRASAALLTSSNEKQQIKVTVTLIFFEKLRNYAAEVNIYYIGSIPKEISVDDSSVKADLRTYLPRDLFPAMRNVPYCTLEKQGKIWERLLFGLAENRGKETVSDSEVLISSYDIYSIEFDVYIRTYFHICLLIYGKLVSLEDMQKIGVF